MAAQNVYEEEHLERLLRVATCLAMCGYGAQVAQLAATARAFYSDAQVWAAQVHHRGAQGRRTHLMHAARKGSTARVQYLLDRGAAVDAVTVVGRTALMLASDSGHLETVRCLVERGGANVNAARTSDGMTALMYASEKGRLEIVRCLVERGGANVNAARDDDGVTSLMLASSRGHLETVCILLQHGENKHAASMFGSTALSYALAHPLVQAALS